MEKFKKTQKTMHGITLVSLVITIILLLILAGITISSLTGSGLFENAKLAEQKSKNAREKEEGILADYENKIGEYIDGSNRDEVIISMQDLNTLIENKVKEQLNSSLTQLTGIKKDTYICNSKTDVTTYNTVTSMTGFTRTTDENNKISEYLSYSTTDGYTVLKSGWYYIDLFSDLVSNGASAALQINFHVNNNSITNAYSWSRDNAYRDQNRNSFSIYLVEGDKIFFSANAGGSSATTREAKGYCYPMF